MGTKLPVKWLVEPLNDATNEKIAAYIKESQANEDLVECKGDTGKSLRLWELPDYAHLQFLLRSARSLGMKFTVYKRITPTGFAYKAPSWA